MGDMGEVFNAYRQDRKAKKEQNLTNSVAILDEKQIEYTMPSYTHYVVKFGDSFVDYWPSTGKFICRKSKKVGRGIRNLIKHIGA